MPNTIPLRQLVLYKHGVGYFIREGMVNGRELLLPFRANEVDDALKSLTVFTLEGGQVTGVHYRTPEDQGERLAEIPLSLGDEHSLFDLLRDLRGTDVSLELRSGQSAEGRVLGVEEHAQGREHGATLVLLTGPFSIEQFPTEEIARIELGDERLARDLNTFLDVSRSDEARRDVIVALSEPGRQVQASYTIPSPVWRVSYRLVDASESQNDRQERRPCLLQGWGIFDNRLDEDLEDVEVTLVAGQPVSFRYDLTSSVIPERRFVRDEARIAAGPVEFDAAVEAPAPPPPAAAAPMAVAEFGPANTPAFVRRAPAALRMTARSMDAASLEGSTAAAAEGRELDELFEYRLGDVSVKRGESAMVPVVQHRGTYRRELLYNGSKQPTHPVVSLRLRNETGLTLERGPVTVVEDGQYRGEAMLPFTKADSEIVLAFAVELGIKVQEEVNYSTTMTGLALEDSLFVHVQEHQNRSVTYRLVNNTTEEQTVTIEQARWAELTDTPKPDEDTGEHRRWRVVCPSRRETRFEVTERRLIERREAVQDQALETLSSYLETRFLDRAARKKLEAILRLRRRMHEIDRQMDALQGEWQDVGSRQDRLRENLGITATSEQEEEIRRRSAEQFRRTQDREEGIDQELERLKAEREQAEGQLQMELNRL